MTSGLFRHFNTSAFIFSLLFLLSISAVAQKSEYTVTGKVTDEGGIPLEYATISFQKVDDRQNLTGGITTPDGTFSIGVAGGTYDITVEFISFEPKVYKNRQINADLNMGTIVLGMAAGELDEVVVTAETTQVEVRLDKKIYNIGKDLTTQGGTVADALNNVPSVAVDVEGGISLRGNENVRILINGKPSAMAGFGNTDVLSQLPADAIERVEVITSPSARYDAEGTAGILNIILRKEKTLGFNGSFTAQAGYPDNAGLSANLNLRSEKFNLFNTTGYRYSNAPGSMYANTLYFARRDENGEIISDPYRLIEDREMDRLYHSFNTNLGLEYFITDQSSITGTVFYRKGERENETNNFSSRFTTASDLLRKTTRTERENRDDESYQFSLNYMNKFDNKGHQLTADLQFERDDSKEENRVNEILNINNLPDTPNFQDEIIYTDEKQKEYLAQIDYVRPIGENSQFEAGYRGNFENEITDYALYQDNTLNNRLSNIFDYSENVNSLYTQYGTKFGDFSFLLGLRLENTQLKGEIDSELTPEELREEFGIAIETEFDKNYLGLFPTVNLIYELGEMENITLGYNRRINRPRSWYINPFPSRSSRTNIFQGNPNLEPAFSDAFDLGYLKRWGKLTLTSSVYYQHETDSFERIQESTGQYTEEDNILITRTIPVNLSTNDRVGAELGLLYNPAKWLRLNGSFNFFQFNSEGEFEGKDYGVKNTNWFARFSSKVTLPADIQWQTNAFYFGGSENIQGSSEGMLSIDLALAKDLFKERATLSFNVRDLLNSRKRESFTTTEFFERESEFSWRQRSFSVSFTYRFNQQRREQERQRRDDQNEEMEMEGGEF